MYTLNCLLTFSSKCTLFTGIFTGANYQSKHIFTLLGIKLHPRFEKKQFFSAVEEFAFKHLLTSLIIKLSFYCSSIRVLWLRTYLDVWLTLRPTSFLPDFGVMEGWLLTRFCTAIYTLSLQFSPLTADIIRLGRTQTFHKQLKEWRCRW